MEITKDQVQNFCLDWLWDTDRDEAHLTITDKLIDFCGNVQTALSLTVILEYMYSSENPHDWVEIKKDRLKKLSGRSPAGVKSIINRSRLRVFISVRNYCSKAKFLIDWDLFWQLWQDFEKSLKENK